MTQLMNSAFVGYKLKSVVARITTLALDLLCNKFRCCKLWQYVAQSRSDRVLLFATNFQFYHLHHNLLHFTTLVIGQFSCTKNAGKMVSKRALDLGHFRFGQEVNMAEIVEVENAETQDCEFISEKMSEAQRKDFCKGLEKHPYL